MTRENLHQIREMALESAKRSYLLITQAQLRASFIGEEGIANREDISRFFEAYDSCIESCALLRLSYGLSGEDVKKEPLYILTSRTAEDVRKALIELIMAKPSK